MLSVQTDMSIPQDVDDIRLEISAYGNLLFGNNYSLGPGKLMLPATMTILAGETASPPVLIRLIARQTGRLRTIREAVTTVPADRTALLR
ncbi:MAG: hypothetical protein MUF54_21265, partial [Polyangiaceae bacterium]|nr:hypothetical protein [Polyangiaceae bacterium]